MSNSYRTKDIQNNKIKINCRICVHKYLFHSDKEIIKTYFDQLNSYKTLKFINILGGTCTINTEN